MSRRASHISALLDLMIEAEPAYGKSIGYPSVIGGPSGPTGPSIPKGRQQGSRTGTDAPDLSVDQPIPDEEEKQTIKKKDKRGRPLLLEPPPFSGKSRFERLTGA